MVNLCQVLILRKWYNHIDKPSSDGTQEHIKSTGGETMFKNQRYLTRGVQSEIPIELQLFMWRCIDGLPEECDYFQVFRLENINGKQKITHFSEQPEYHREYLIQTGNPITAKVYIIDSDTYSTMLLAEEY